MMDALSSNGSVTTQSMDDDLSKLGELVAIHRWHALDRHDLWWILTGMVCLLLPAVYGAWLFYWLQEKNGLLAAFYRIQPWLLIIYFVFLSLSCLLIYRLWSSRRYVAVYQNGIVWRLKGFKTNSLLWEEMEGIVTATIDKKFLGKTLNYEEYSILYRKSGLPVEFDDRIQDQPSLIEEIKKQYFPMIYPDLKAKFESGKEINFGPISIQNQSIHYAKTLPPGEFIFPYRPFTRVNSVPWSQVIGFTVNSGFLVVKSGNSMIKRIPISMIPNFEILLKLIEHEVKL